MHRNKPRAPDLCCEGPPPSALVIGCIVFRQSSNLIQVFAAEAAIGRKQRSEQALGETASPGSNRRPTGYTIGLRSPSSVPSTAEDDLPPSGGYIRAPTRRIPISIAAPLASRNPLIGASVAGYLLL